MRKQGCRNIGLSSLPSERWRSIAVPRPAGTSRRTCSDSMTLWNVAASLECKFASRICLANMSLATVYRTFSAGDAQLVRSRLEASELQATVAHELSVLSMDGYAQSRQFMGDGGLKF